MEEHSKTKKPIRYVQTNYMLADISNTSLVIPLNSNGLNSICKLLNLKAEINRMHKK